MLVYVCVSAHGFGTLRPDWRLVVSTGIPNGFLDLVLGETPHAWRRCR